MIRVGGGKGGVRTKKCVGLWREVKLHVGKGEVWEKVCYGVRGSEERCGGV